MGPPFAIVTRRSTSRSRSRSRIARRPAATFARPTSRPSAARSLSSPTIRRSRASIRWRSRRISGLSGTSVGADRRSAMGLTEASGDGFERELVASWALADDRLERDVREVVHVPERLAARGVREMDLDERPLHGGERVAQGDRGVRQATRVDDRHVEVALVEAVDERALVVALEEREVEPERRRRGAHRLVDLLERLRAVDLRLPR